MSLRVPDFSAVKVLVAGDLMLDQYWFGGTSRISPEAPVPVVKLDAAQARAGGAANVAVNLASLGAHTSLAGVMGADDNGERLHALLAEQGIELLAARSANQPTITKLRVLSRNQQLIRLDTENCYGPEESSQFESLFTAQLDQADACVLSDYGKGTLHDIAGLIAACRDRQVPVLVDPKGTDFSKYRGATLLTPNLAEFEAVMGASPDDETLISRAQALRAELELEGLLVTLSERGMLVVDASGDVVFLGARAREVFDVTGAGDTVIATLAGGVALKLPLQDSAALANLAAGLVVRKIGVASVTPSELRSVLHEHGQGGRDRLLREEAIHVAAEARARGERVVMTNGCFDILHRGHVAYLEEAKARGDRLLVAVNDDASVTRLKGKGRPINSLDDRMAVLSGLASVDWVVSFSEDTPAELIAAVQPDVLVKGGDYRAEEIAGGAEVLRNGGIVEVLSYREGRSTSALIEAIRRLP